MLLHKLCRGDFGIYLCRASFNTKIDSCAHQRITLAKRSLSLETYTRTEVEKVTIPEVDELQHNANSSRVPKGHWTNKSTQRDALEKLGLQLGVKGLDDWYNVDAKTVRKQLSFLSSNYKNCLFSALKTLYPHHNWDPLKFSKVPRGVWKDINTQRNALEKLGQRLGVKELDDWYAVDIKTVRNELSFMTYYRNSLSDALKELYPHHNWDFSKFLSVTDWKNINTQRNALELLRKQLGVKELDDWYSVDTSPSLTELCFNMKYTSVYHALKAVYPHHNWDPLKFSKPPKGSWKSISAQRNALEKLGKRLGVKELDDWYAVDAGIVRKELSFIAQYYNHCLYDTLTALYPQHDWDPRKFSKVPKGSLRDINSQRAALEKLGLRLGVEKLDDWYSVPTTSVFTELRFISNYGTLYDTLCALYPQHKWDPLKFQRLPYGFWYKDSTVQYYRELFNEWKRQYNICTLKDWLLLPPQQLKQFKRAAVGIFGTKMKMMKEWFPEMIWNSQFNSQCELQGLLHHVLSDYNIKHYRLRYVSTPDLLSLDHRRIIEQQEPSFKQLCIH